jgi:hypothetical protein
VSAVGTKKHTFWRPEKGRFDRTERGDPPKTPFFEKYKSSDLDISIIYYHISCIIETYNE